MKLHEIKPAVGSTAAPKRLGRGIGSGLGKTSGKGHKGAKARSGGGKRPGFEGGQMPKYGFTNIFRKEYVAINVSRLEVFEDGMTVGPVELIEEGIIKKIEDGIKIMGDGELTKKLTVQAMKFTASAKAKIEAAGGKCEVL